MMKRILFTLLIASITTTWAKADEGMWLPVLVQQLNMEDMRAKGFKLDAKDIYNINKACIKDAVAMFGGGCTSEVISKDGLVLTNHHCGYGQIQQHSSVDHDYLTDGFWAKSRAEELPNPGLKVTFLRSMKEVSKEVMEGITEGMSETERNKIIQKNSDVLCKQATQGTDYTAQVKSFFNDNVYYLLIQEVFSDVRLVGCPPSAIGKFGGDTDNWMWPRHGGDFSLFRIYANANNKPANYSTANVPYHPSYSLPISLDGVKEGDFTFVMGYPYTTNEYAPAKQLEMLTQVIYPQLIAIRGKKLDIINASMESDPKIRIQYSAKAASLGNGWKKWMGEIKGLQKLDAMEKKQEFEKGFNQWAQDHAEYKNLLARYDALYPNYERYEFTRAYFREITGTNGMEFVNFIGKLNQRVNAAVVGKSLSDSLWNQWDVETKAFFKDYDQHTDAQLTEMILLEAQQHLDKEFLPKLVAEKQASVLRDQAFKSPFIHSFSVLQYKDKPEVLVKKLKKDPANLLYEAFDGLYEAKVKDSLAVVTNDKRLLDRSYMKGQMEYEKTRKFYPDANATLRLSYGKVAGYEARDGVHYQAQTFLRGVLEKDNPMVYDYRVPAKLKSLYEQKDFGRYAQDGDIPVCFLATNHTTGGNSGSPVMNAYGELIGINFDRDWEGVMSDLMYNPEQCRNISVDIRYILFIIDKYAGAGYLLNEMDLRKHTPIDATQSVYDCTIEAANNQYAKALEANTDSTKIPRTINKRGELASVGKYDWTSGFFAGDMWYMYELTGDPKWRKEANHFTNLLEPIQYYKGLHDVGFMMMTSYGNALRITKNDSIKQVIINTAKSLSSRFDPRVGCIKSWNRSKSWDGKTVWYYPVIIDNMMNLELLFEASRLSGDKSFKNIAIKHADKTMLYHYRPNYSSYHVVNYDTITGKPLNRETAQGYSNNSSWARGQAWGLYGYVVCYRETKDKKYLEFAEHIANYIMHEKRLPADKIPLWDYNVNEAGYHPLFKYDSTAFPVIPRDVSAAAVTASALFELSTLAKDGKQYYNFANDILNSLKQPKYLAQPWEKNYFILKESVGSIPHGNEIRVPLNYADYYFLEALLRKKNIDKK